MSQELEKLLHRLDKSQEKTSEYSISSKIDQVTSKDQNLNAVAERMAFSFCENCADRNAGWGTYFGPMVVWPEDDGQIYESPSLSRVNEDVIKYWSNRVAVTNNQLMKARYSGLVWDLTEKVLGERPDHNIAIQYIESLIEVCDQDLSEQPTEAIQKISRAYEVASNLNNPELIKRCIESAINLEDKVAEDDKAGLWGFCFKKFILDKCQYVSEQQSYKLITDLEERLIRVSSGHSPWVCESAGIPLATYYRRKNQPEDVKRIIEIVGKCFESSCEGLPALQASSWYQHIHGIYLHFNLKENAEIVLRKIAEIGPDVVAGMHKFSHSIDISKEKFDADLDSMTSGGLEETFKRIAVQFVPNKDEVEQQALNLAKKHPITYLFTKKLQDYSGIPVATIGGIEDDLEGNTIHQLSQNMVIESLFLRASFEKAFETYNVNAKDLTEYIFQSPIFEESKKEILQSGVDAYLKEDYIVAIHILIPQAEAAIRTLVKLTGGDTLRPNRQGGLQLRTFDDLLRDELVERCFGPDSSFYFRMLFTDQRGWNVRNDVCHGISPANAFNHSTADRVMHVMLCLAGERE